MKMYSDYHVHTNYSDDSTYLMEDVIKDAIKMKMDEICFTDHVDYGIKKDLDEGPIEYLYGQPQVNVDYPKFLITWYCMNLHTKFHTLSNCNFRIFFS